MGLTAKKIAGSVPPGGAGGQPRGGTLRRSFPRTWQIFRTVVTSKSLIHSMCSVAAAVDGLFAVVPFSLTLFIHSLSVFLLSLACPLKRPARPP